MAELQAKRQKVQEDGSAAPAGQDPDRKVLAQLRSETGETAGPALELPANVTPKQLQVLCTKLLEEDDQDPVPYAFFVNDEEITTSLADLLAKQEAQAEEIVTIVYQPQAVFRVLPISQCSATIAGHAENIVDVAFSPDGSKLATGSGDKTVRFWDVWTMTPRKTMSGHTHWVQCIAWSPDGLYVASGSRDNEIRVWDGSSGAMVGKPLKGHRNFITWISWEPLHCSDLDRCYRLASASKDGTVRIWDVIRGNTIMTLAQHTKGVTCVKWGGDGLIYTASQDTTIKVWRAQDGTLCRTLQGHAHWVNNLSLSTDHVLRLGPFDDYGKRVDNAKEHARKRYEAVKGEFERLISASEDNTLYLWDPARNKKPLTRLTGHQKGINFAQFSPDGRLIVSCSFDKSAKLWDGRTGKFLGTFRGHVGPVFRSTWASDSRLVITASEDSTLKLWNVKTQKLVKDLPGHAGSVFAVDWSPNGELVASGGADKMLKIWRR